MITHYAAGSGLWVEQRFSAALTALFSTRALAPAVLQIIFPQLLAGVGGHDFSRAAKH
jgi:hypothetical protein